MLEVKPVLDIQDRQNLLKTFRPQQAVWVVSDIKSRDFIRQSLGPQKCSAECVFRAVDFWALLLKDLQPEVRIAARSFLVFLYQKWAGSQKEEWKKSKQAGFMVCRFVKTFAHLLLHPERDRLMQEWFACFPPGRVPQWKPWYQLAVGFLDELTKKNIVESSWADVCLLDKTKFLRTPWKDMIFDLGPLLDEPTAELIRQFSTHKKVTVMAPVIWENGRAQYASSIYESFGPLSVLKPPPPRRGDLKCKKFAAQLAEVKDIVCEVRQAIQQGIQPSKIVVAAPLIEDYWFCLKSFFKKEGIKINKKELSYLSSFPFVQLWLARLWTHLEAIEYENLEAIACFYNKQKNFKEFRAQYYNVLSLKEVPSFCYEKSLLKNKNHTVLGAGFLKWALTLKPKSFLNSAAQKALDECLEEFLKSAPSAGRLEYEAWLSWLEVLFKNKEILTAKEEPEGVQCLSMNALSYVPADMAYIAGLSEQALEQKTDDLIFESEQLKTDMGFFIKTDNPSALQQTINSFAGWHRKKTIMSCSVFDFSARPLSPSSLWLKQFYREGGQKHSSPKTDLPLTAWDKQQRQKNIQDILGQKLKPFAPVDLIQRSIQEDEGKITPQPYALNSLKKLSHSSLSAYAKCPFIYSAQHLFKLMYDEGLKNIDYSPLQRGRFVHSLFEKIKTLGRTDFSDADFLKEINKLKDTGGFKPLNKIMWEKEKLYFLNKARRFAQHEKHSKVFFKKTKTKACELKFECFWDTKNQCLARTGDVPFSGVIDRVDECGSSYMALDYKNTFPEGAIAKNWGKKYQFQLALYMQALEKGLTGLDPLPVWAALFLSYKNFYYQGLAVKMASWPGEENFAGLSKRAGSVVSEQDKQKILNEISRKISEVIVNIQSGEWSPKPLDLKTCDTCQWRKICRAVHLN